MLAIVALLPLLGALSSADATAVNPLAARDAVSIFPRQLDSSTVPTACTSTCASAVTIYNACTSNDLTTCLSVCQQDTFNSFTGCFDCIITNTPGVTSSEESQLDQAVQQLASVCGQAGQTVTGGLDGAASASATATGSGVSTGIIASATSISGFTSAGGITVGGSVSSIASSAVASASASIASAGTSATVATTTAAAAGTTSAAAATSSGAAGAASSAASSTAAKSSAQSVLSVNGGVIGAAVALGLTAVGAMFIL